AIFREAECGRAAIEGIGPCSVIQLQGNADRVYIVLPLTHNSREAMARRHFPGALGAIAHFRPAAAVMFAQFAQQGGPLFRRQRTYIRATHRRGCTRYPRTDVELHAERQPVTALPEIDHTETV